MNTEGEDAAGSQDEAASLGEQKREISEVCSLGAAELSRLFAAGELTSLEATEALIARIESLDSPPDGLRSVLELAPDAVEQSARLDAERRAGRVRGPLHGVPLLLKDNIDTAAPLHTTAGSFVFGESSPASDASLVRALREAGAIVLGKTNLSEWANFRSRPSSSGWSAVGGQTRNPHAIERSPGGSSAGSGAAVAARLASLAVGTETDGSIICPAAVNGVVALKPTVGLVSRTGVVPIASSQDTAGPIGRRVADVALALEAMARSVGDGEDELATLARRPTDHETHYLSLLGDGSLKGLRIGLLRGGGFVDYHPPTDRVFSSAIESLSLAGAEVIDDLQLDDGPLVSRPDELKVLSFEFRLGIEAYLARRRAGDPAGSRLPSSIEELITAMRSDRRERLDLFGLELIEMAASTRDGRAEYEEARSANETRARAGIDGLFAGERPLDVIAVPATSPAWLIDPVLGDPHVGSGWSPPAVAGYPSATIPMGMVGGLPVGLALWGPAWSEALLLRVLFAVEKTLGTEVTSPRPLFKTERELRG